MTSVEKLKAILTEVTLGKEDLVELLPHLMWRKLTFREIMKEAFRLKTSGRFRRYFKDTYYVHGMPFCPILERDIGILVAVGILLPQKDKETFVVSPAFLPSWPK
jgi:hypothetical protein